MQRQLNEGKPCFLKDNMMMINQINKNNAAPVNACYVCILSDRPAKKSSN
jgi:hypothetical protein